MQTNPSQIQDRENDPIENQLYSKILEENIVKNRSILKTVLLREDTILLQFKKNAKNTTEPKIPISSNIAIKKKPFSTGALIGKPKIGSYLML